MDNKCYFSFTFVPFVREGKDKSKSLFNNNSGKDSPQRENGTPFSSFLRKEVGDERNNKPKFDKQ